jgi:hypothetical protein
MDQNEFKQVLINVGIVSENIKNLTEEENEIYNKILESCSIKTGRNYDDL